MPDTKPVLLYITIYLILVFCLVSIIAYFITGKYYLKRITAYPIYHRQCIWHHPLKQTWYICLALFNMGDIQWIDTNNPFIQLPLEKYRRHVDTIISSIYITIYGLLASMLMLWAAGLIIVQIGFLIIHGQLLWHHIH